LGAKSLSKPLSKFYFWDEKFIKTFISGPKVLFWIKKKAKSFRKSFIVLEKPLECIKLIGALFFCPYFCIIAS